MIHKHEVNIDTTEDVNILKDYLQKQVDEILSDENCDNVSITIDTLERDVNTKRRNKINLSKRQVQKIIDELKIFL